MDSESEVRATLEGLTWMKIELKSRSLLERVPLAKVPDVVFGCQMAVVL